MILEYEAALLKWFRYGIKDLNTIEFSTRGVDPLYNMSQVLKYPSVAIQREISDGNLNVKSFDLDEDPDGIAKLFVLLQTYKAYVYLGKATDGINMLVNMRYFTEQHPYICVNWNGSIIPIGARVQYISMEEEQNGDDPKGARRAVTITWQSSIPICGLIPIGEIKQVKISLDPEGKPSENVIVVDENEKEILSHQILDKD